MLKIQTYTKNKIPDVLDFERRLRERRTFGVGLLIRIILML